MAAMPIDNYEKSEFTAATREGHSICHDVYQRGSGKQVVLIQELPGIGQETLHLADRLVEAGFRVTMPHLFGPLGKTSIAGNLARVFCLRREFSVFQANRSSPIVDWLKALCSDVKAKTTANGVGVIGMCLTGNFAITLMADDNVLAAVASQPAMPFGKPSALHMSEDEAEAVRTGIDNKAPIKAYRFEADPMCTAAKFNALESAFNTEKERVEMTVIPGKGHSVLTLDFVDEKGHPTHKALEEIITYFGQQLS